MLGDTGRPTRRPARGDFQTAASDLGDNDVVTLGRFVTLAKKPESGSNIHGLYL